jgi:hypothetical protein
MVSRRLAAVGTCLAAALCAAGDRPQGGGAALPLCYGAGAPGPRLGELDGAWVRDARAPPYWNLSCPLEFSKYGCMRHGPDGSRAAAARLRFAPRGCRFVELGDGGRALFGAVGNRTVLLYGDSLTRQLYQAMGCLVAPAQLSVRWSSSFACAREPNCVPGGPHSFFERSSFRLGGDPAPPALTDPEERVADAAYGLKVHVGRRTQMLGALTRRDVVVVGAGVHAPVARSTKGITRWLAPILALDDAVRPRVVVFVTPPPAFPSRDGDGEYDGDFLAALQAANASDVRCRAAVRNARRAGELGWVAAPPLAGKVDAVLSLAGVEALGFAKVGAPTFNGGIGRYGDCQHYCMPGVPDELARALYTLLATLGDS